MCLTACIYMFLLFVLSQLLRFDKYCWDLLSILILVSPALCWQPHQNSNRNPNKKKHITHLFFFLLWSMGYLLAYFCHFSFWLPLPHILRTQYDLGLHLRKLKVTLGRGKTLYRIICMLRWYWQAYKKKLLFTLLHLVNQTVI